MGRLISCARLRNSRSTGCPEAPVGVGTGDQALRVSWVIGAYAVSPRVAHERSPTAAVENQAAAVGVRTDSVGRGPESAIPERSAISDRPLAECRARPPLAGGQAWASVPRYSSMTFGSLARFLPVPVYAFLPWSRT